MWFELKGDRRLRRCMSEGCHGQTTWRLESGGIGSDYCSGCKEKIAALEIAGLKVALSTAVEPDTIEFHHADGRVDKLKLAPH